MLTDFDILLAVSDYNEDAGEDGLPPTIGDLTQQFIKEQEIDFESFQKMLKVPLSDLLESQVEEGRLERKFKSAGYRYTLTTKGKRYVKSQLE